MKKLKRKEFLIGLVVLVAMAVLIVGIDFLKGVNIFKASNYYYASYDNVQGLAVSAPVELNGFKVGQVREITYEYDNPGHVLVEISLDKALKVPQGSKAELVTDLLGTASLTLVFSDSKEMHKPGDYLDATIKPGLLGAVGSDLMPAVNRIMPRIDTLLANLNAITGDEALRSSIKRLDEITANLATTSARLSSLIATLPPVANNLNTITSNFNTTSADLAVLSAKLRDLPVDSLAQNLTVISENLAQLSATLNDPNSTLGLLTRDPALYQNVNRTISNLDSLFVDIKRNPKRYISIKLL